MYGSRSHFVRAPSKEIPGACVGRKSICGRYRGDTRLFDGYIPYVCQKLYRRCAARELVCVLR